MGSTSEFKQTPELFTLYPNYPNPFNSATTISFDVSSTSKVKLLVYDLAGKEVFTLTDAVMNPGTYYFKWAGTDDSGQNVPSGIYFYALRAEAGEKQTIQTGKAVLIK
jgi:flagellar hook assembly protein FlgD